MVWGWIISFFINLILLPFAPLLALSLVWTTGDMYSWVTPMVLQLYYFSGVFNVPVFLKCIVAYLNFLFVWSIFMFFMMVIRYIRGIRHTG